jgi:GT2 family glycosyltransferase
MTNAYATIPRVLIVLVNFKGHLDTVECLETVLKSDYPDFKVAIVDNSENNISIDYLAAWAQGKVTAASQYPDLVFPPVAKPIPISFFADGDPQCNFSAPITILSTKNRGFAAANNAALKLALREDFDFFWLLNNDTVVPRDALSALVTAASLHDDLGILGSKLLLYNNPSVLQGVGGNYNKWVGKVNEIGAFEPDRQQWDNVSLQMDYVIGASMFVSKKFLASVGLMNEDLFLYYEELDWALRAKKKGWRLGFVSSSAVYHKGGASINKSTTKGNSLLSDFYAVRNRILMTRKFFPYALITLYPSFLMFIWNRIKLKQYARIGVMFKIMLHPKRQFADR